ncbi:hypothetical protein [Flavobacterium crassostreae]|uniref:Hydrolase n=1 Tax=Flavobacterium crassostreae TaxID=1763534 RepID=A0A1B9E2E7_9FLAO|nr:hypothetical protein [Flavobacterium crassostreae]OCB76110.1 hypothetical protein LPBF_07305 [Flavobacterium crassostreae]
MKKSFLLYAFIILILLNVFTYTFYSKQVAFEQDRYQRVTKKLKEKIQTTESKLVDASYFTLENNENAQNYFESEDGSQIIQHQKLIPFVTERLLDYNANPKGNPYTGQDQIGVSKFIINKVKILNHRWIIADFSDGSLWGEVLLKYFVNEDQTISFEVNQSLLYQK